jgi:hypothetical protein
MIVEDGTGKSDANSYVSVAFADAYFAARNGAAWALLGTPAKQANLIQATDYIEATYGQSFKGQKATAVQALAWPRKYVVIDGFDVASNHIPPVLMNAVCELALKVQDGPLVEDQKQRVAKKKVDVLEVTYADNSDPAKRFPMVARMLASLTTSASDGGGFQSVKVVRV